MSQSLVSVCIITYQHARFIARTIEGALMQRTDFQVEILIGEDESTDGTREICIDYARRNPDRIKVFQRSRRDVVFIDGRPRGSYNFQMTLAEARGEFVALCEGDDFWTDPEKLQRQVDYLRANPDCAGCFHDAKLVDAEGKTLLKSYFQSDQEKFTQRDVLETLLSKEPTCSLVFRKAAFAEPLPEWYLRRPSDLYLDILLTNQGSLGFVRRNMGAYRKHVGGIWSGQREAHQIIELIIRYKLLLADPFFLGEYKDLLLRKIDEFQATLFTHQDLGEEIKRLQGVVMEQTRAIQDMQAECVRLTAEAKTMQSDNTRAAKDAQKHIDELLAQVKKLAATSRQQSEHIAVLEKERDRLTAESKVAKAEATRAAKDGQKHIDELLAQIKKLSATSQEQDKYIATLENQRDKLNAESKAARTEASRSAKDAQKYIDELLEQGRKLAATSQEQTKYIAILEKERDRLTALTATGTKETERLGRLISEQAAYIKALEAQRALTPRK